MAVYRVQGPDGQIHRFEGPDDATPEQVTAAAAKVFSAPAPAKPDTEAMAGTPGNFGENFAAGLGNIALGAKQSTIDRLQSAVSGTPVGSLVDKARVSMGKPTLAQSVAETQQAIDQGAPFANKLMMHTGGGFLGGVVGNALEAYGLGRLASALPGASAASTSLAAVAPKIAPYALAAAGGAGVGAVQPTVTGEGKGASVASGAAGGVIGQAIGKGITNLAKGASDTISQGVKDLAARARQLNIPLRAEQLLDSKPLNAVSAGLEYLPLSGAAASKSKQVVKFNQALSKTVGEDTPNMAEALKNADARLGAEFDRVLSSHSVKADPQFQGDLARILADAGSEMNDQQHSIIQKQVANILGKVGQNGDIDAQAAYNAKKVLDRLGKSSDTSVAYWAREMRGTMMEALNRSLPPDVAASFAKTRQQYGNMLALEKIVPANDVEALVSPARLANMRDIRNPDLKELAAIGALIKPKVGDSGTAPRQLMGGVIGGAAYVNPKAVATGLTAGRLTNAALESNALQRYLLGGSQALGAAAPVAKAVSPTVGQVLGVRLNPLFMSPQLQQQ